MKVVISITKNDIVSCIILSYKKFDFLYESIDSILNQDYPNIEIIICDDCSPNFEKDKITNYINSKKLKNVSNLIVYKQENNLGTVKNFNSAIKLSSGKYIFPLSSDDLFIDKNVISNIVSFFQKTNLLIVTSYRDIYSEDLSYLIKKEPSKRYSKFLKKDSLAMYKKLSLGNFISGSCTYYTKDFFDRYGLFDENYLLLEDYPKYLSLYRQGGQIGFTDFTTIKYRNGGISTGDVISLKLENDYKLVYETEIFPYKKILGLLLYRKVKYQYTMRFKKTNYFNNAIKSFLHLDIIISHTLFTITKTLALNTLKKLKK